MHWKELIDSIGAIRPKARELLAILAGHPDKHDSVALANELGIKGDTDSKRRSIRKLCQILAFEGVPVVGDHGGVWLTANPSEVHDYVVRRKAEADAAYATTIERLQRMKDTAHRMEFGKAGEQTSIFDEAI